MRMLTRMVRTVQGCLEGVSFTWFPRGWQHKASVMMFSNLSSIDMHLMMDCCCKPPHRQMPAETEELPADEFGDEEDDDEDEDGDEDDLDEPAAMPNIVTPHPLACQTQLAHLLYMLLTQTQTQADVLLPCSIAHQDFI